MVSATLKKDARVARKHYAAARGARVDWIQAQRIRLANEDEEIERLLRWCDSIRGGG